MDGLIVWILVATLAALCLAALVFGRKLGARTALAGVCLIGGVAAYGVFGRPASPDMPISSRVDELQERARNLSPGGGLQGLAEAGFTGDEVMALLEDARRNRPEDPLPHFFIGQVLAAQGRDEDAIRAFRSALRRDPQLVPAMSAFADALVRIDGEGVPLDAERIYADVARLDPEDVRSVIMIGAARLEAGDVQGATDAWDELDRRLPQEDPRRAMLAAMRDRTAELETTEMSSPVSAADGGERMNEAP